MPADDAAAVRLYRVAAEHGDRDGIFRLGRSYYAGNGVERNLDTALELFNRADRMDMGSPAWLMLARTYDAHG